MLCAACTGGTPVSPGKFSRPCEPSGHTMTMYRRFLPANATPFIAGLALCAILLACSHPAHAPSTSVVLPPGEDAGHYVECHRGVVVSVSAAPSDLGRAS